MSVDRLLEEGKVHRFEATRDEIKKSLGIAKRDLSLGEKIFEEDLDWCFSITYNAILQACRAYMLSLGYRAASSQGHKAVFQFMELMMEEPYKEMITYFDRARKKRHRTMYDEVGLVSKGEAKELLQMAKGFIAEIEKRVMQ